MRFTFALFIATFFMSSFALSLDPATMKIKVYKFAVSTSLDCTNPVTVLTDENPSYTDFLTGPTIGSGSVADGSYPCLIIEMSDYIKFRPATTSGSCSSSTEYTMDVCRGMSSRLIDGTSVTCGETGEDRVAIYITTNAVGNEGQNCSDNSQCNSFLPYNATTNRFGGIPLAAALTIAGSASGTFYVDGTGKVSGSSSQCDMNPPVFGFR